MPNSAPIQVLIVEGEADHAEIMSRALLAAELPMKVTCVDTMKKFRILSAENPPDIVLMDLTMPDGQALDILVNPPENGPFPILVITSQGNEQLAVAVMKAGALDYVVKSPEAFEAIPRIVRRNLRQWKLLQERKHAEERLRTLNAELEQRIVERTMQQEQLKHLVEDLFQAEERERRRIAGELHDSIGQSLALAKIRLKRLSMEQNECSVDEILKPIDESIQQIRSLTFQISPPLLYEVGLEAAIEGLAERLYDEHGLVVQVRTNYDSLVLSEGVRVMLYQVLRELLMNVVKHGCSRQCIITFDQSDLLTITLEDDGTGFNVEETIQGRKGAVGFGLFNVRQKIERAGGSFTVHSSVGCGTRVVLNVPLLTSKGAKT